VSHRLGGGYEQVAARPQSSGQPGVEPISGGRVKVDAHVAAKHEIKVAQAGRWVLVGQVVPAKGDQLGYLGQDAVAVLFNALVLGAKIAPPGRIRHQPQRAPPIAPSLRHP